jgi:hypothetical protein
MTDEPEVPPTTHAATEAPPPAPDPLPDAARLPEPAITPDAAMRTLPGARSLISAGFDLLQASRGQLTQTSLYFGLLTLLTLGPAVMLLIYFVIRQPDLFTTFINADPANVPTEPPTGLVMVALAFLFAVPALVAISIEAELMAVAILAGQRVGRPASMEEALRRSRQAFWRVVLASLIVGGASFVIIIALGEVFGAAMSRSTELNTLISATLGIVFGLPFAYSTTGIVLGDAGPVQTLGRSLRLARARPMLALVIALFTTAVGVINEFALGAGGDTLVRIAEFLHLDFQSGPLLTILSVALVLAGVVALGSLVFTISAVTTAPQVVAFLGLTHVSAGLDKARLVTVAAPAPVPPVPPVAEADENADAERAAQPLPAESTWSRAAAAAAAKDASDNPPLVSWPMFIFAVLAGLCAVVGFANLAGS